MICDKCGSEIQENVKFCTTCGNKLNFDLQQGAYGQQINYTQPQQLISNMDNVNSISTEATSATKIKINNKKFKPIAIIVSVVVVIILGVLLLNKISGVGSKASSEKVDLFEIVDVEYTETMPLPKVKLVLKKDKIDEYAYWFGHEIRSFTVEGTVAHGETIKIVLDGEYVADLYDDFGISLKETEKEITVDYDVQYVKEMEEISDEIIDEMQLLAADYISHDVYERYNYSPENIILGETKYYGEAIRYYEDFNSAKSEYCIAFETMVTINDPANGINTTIPVYHYVRLNQWSVVNGGEAYVRTVPQHTYPAEYTIKLENAAGDDIKYYFPGNCEPKFDDFEFITLDR